MRMFCFFRTRFSILLWC